MMQVNTMNKAPVINLCFNLSFFICLYIVYFLWENPHDYDHSPMCDPPAGSPWSIHLALICFIGTNLGC